jgi:glyoxylase-like metal-dependent hydrolase (beta-lactamase superfamily II)
MIEVLFEGAHKNHSYPDGHYSIQPLGSSVTLIRHEGVNVLFDTSSHAFKAPLLEALKEQGLQPGDIHHVINSHYHLDHCFNDYLFADSASIHTGNASLHPDGEAHIYPDISIRPLPKGIELIKTPGHSGPDVSLVYEWEGETWMCVGDAVREDILRGESRLTASDPERFVESMRLIFNRADVIVPGHGRVIRGALKEELHDVLKRFSLELPD